MELSAARAYADESFDEAVELLRTLARIPAPTGHEERRADFVASWLADAGATRVWIDDAKNVMCLVADEPSAGIEVFSAHTDVVFDDLEPLPLREKGGRMYAPGIGDDTANLVNLMLATRWLLRHPEAQAARSVLVVANSCEEGLGNLRGTRAVYERFGERIASHVAFDLYLGGVVREAVGSLRWRICCDGPGGHSFGDYGTPNAIVELARLACALDNLSLPDSPKTTCNVGIISGGTTVNAIAAHAEMLFELRSVADNSLQDARREFERVVDDFARGGNGFVRGKGRPEPDEGKLTHGDGRRTDAAGRERKGVRYTVELLGKRPGNGYVSIRKLDTLCERACAVTRAAQGHDRVTVAPGSTDANIPLSLGIPAVCMGTVRGGRAHTRDEWIETASLRDGLVAAFGMISGSGFD